MGPSVPEIVPVSRNVASRRSWSLTIARAIGQQGRSLVELRLAVTRPGRKGEGETSEVVPITIWDGALGAALLDLAPGTPLTVVGRISAREWSAPGGQAKTFVEVVGERVTIGVETVGGVNEPREAAPASQPSAEPAAAPSRPAGARPASRSEVPF